MFRLATFAALALCAGLPTLSPSGIVVHAAPSPAVFEPTIALAPRHGGHEHEEEAEQEMHVHMHEVHSQASNDHEHNHMDNHLPPAAGQDAAKHTHAGHHSHSHTTPHVPSIEKIGVAPFVIPYFTGAHTGGHSHGSSDAEPELKLNETNLLLNKGPEPLSYLEWDFNYGMGSREALSRFTTHEYQDATAGSDWGVMGVVDGRYRTLLDEKIPDERAAATRDIASRLGTSEEPSEPGRHKWLMLLHILGASISCFVLLPLTLFLRAAGSSLAPLASLVYLASLTGSLLISSLYKALTPRLYPSNAHSSMGWALLWISVACLGGDIFSLARKVIKVARSTGGSATHKLRCIFGIAVAGHHKTASDQYSALEEESMLAGGEVGTPDHRPTRTSSPHRVHFSDDHAASESPRTSADHPHHRSGSSTRSHSDGATSPTSTLIEPQTAQGRRESTHEPSVSAQFPWKLMSPMASYQNDRSAVADWTRSTSAEEFPAIKPRRSRVKTLRNILRYTHVVVARALPVYSFAVAYTGLAVYTGSCRQPYKNVCLAHGIKGGIFFWYGLLTFGRYLGAYADCGWSWNRRPSPESARKRGTPAWKASMPSAEWVECLIIFTYGVTNTWMERFSAQPGDPYTVKQVQHISIAIMYWFAGSLGVLLETRWVRNLLNVPVALTHPSAREASSARNQRVSGADADQEAIVRAQEAPPSYSGSFNPFPSLCVGVTGIAMAAHHQDYVYEVQIHALWGQLLAGFAVLRCLTYFFLWLRPPMSILPSRPPTEALASFALTAGGLVFMVSSEEVSFAAMRNGFGDFMAIMCIAVAIICFIFALVAALMLVKAWAVRREMRRSQGHEKANGRTAGYLRDAIHERTAAASSAAHNEEVFVLGEGEDDDQEKGTDPQPRT